MIYCTNYKGKDKWCNGAAIEDMYNSDSTTDEIQKEMIWSDIWFAFTEWNVEWSSLTMKWKTFGMSTDL